MNNLTDVGDLYNALISIVRELDDINSNLGWIAGMERCMHESADFRNPNCWHCQHPLKPLKESNKTVEAPAKMPLASLNQNPNGTRTFTAIAKGKPKMTTFDYLNKVKKGK